MILQKTLADFMVRKSFFVSMMNRENVKGV